jgi:hypothetical protein
LTIDSFVVAIFLFRAIISVPWSDTDFTAPRQKKNGNPSPIGKNIFSSNRFECLTERICFFKAALARAPKLSAA